jgi:hypothetical protein
VLDAQAAPGVAQRVQAGVVEEVASTIEAAIGPVTALASKPASRRDLRSASGLQWTIQAQKKRKESGRQPLEVDGGRRQVGLNLHVGEAASHGAREPMPGLGFAMEAL